MNTVAGNLAGIVDSARRRLANLIASIADPYPETCGSVEPKIICKPRLLDWTTLPTTMDQAAIEDSLEAESIEGKAILHVGIGNSSLAKKFSRNASRITGCTVSANEKALAHSLAISSYKVHLLNKYSPRFREVVGDNYDFIVDNNPASYACCRAHYRGMLESYVGALNPNGRILTHLLGMGWSAGPNKRRALAFDDLAALEVLYPLRVSKVTGQVFALTRTSATGMRSRRNSAWDSGC